jgi:hypothetical protein
MVGYHVWRVEARVNHLSIVQAYDRRFPTDRCQRPRSWKLAGTKNSCRHNAATA